MKRLLPCFVICLACDGTTSADSYDDLACHAFGGTVSGVTFTDAEATAVVDMIDHATAAELDAVPSIGPAAASAIIGARPFGSSAAPLTKLDSVSGVGATILKALRDNAEAQWCGIGDGRQSCCSKSGSSVVINEFSPGSAGWVELYNPTSSGIDLTGWAIDDAHPGGSSALTIASGTTIQSHGFAVVQYGGINGASADQVTLLEPSGDVADQTSNFYAGTSLKGKCFARTQDGSGKWSASPATCTEGASNTGTVACAAIGGTYDGATFTRDQECHAVDFLNAARWSEMAALPDAARHMAYDCEPAHAGVACGNRTSAWTTLAEFSGEAGIGPSAMNAIKSSAAPWQQNGLTYDTVAKVWATRVALEGKPVSLDAVYVTKLLPDEPGVNVFHCVEVRDNPTATNYMSACVQDINADSAPPCASATCTQNMVGKWLKLRGTVRKSSYQSGGYKVNLTKNIPGAADPRYLPGASDCQPIIDAAANECGGLGYAEDDCLVQYLASHNATNCTNDLRDQESDDT